MSQKKQFSRIDGELAFAQMDESAQRAIARAVLSKQMQEIGRRVNNADPQKRAIIAAAQRRRWDQWRKNRLAEQHAYNTSKGLPLDTPLPPKPKVARKRVYTRMELLDILEAEMKKAFPEGCTPQNQQAWLSYKPKDPRLEGHV
jgi:hypothetical protein